MSEKHENIEDFVRKVVDQSEAQIPFNESHWLQMESMLEVELPVVVNPGNGYYYFSNVVSLLVGIVFIWFLFTGLISGGNQAITNSYTEKVASFTEEESTSSSASTATAGVDLAANAASEVEVQETNLSKIDGAGQALNDKVTSISNESLPSKTENVIEQKTATELLVTESEESRPKEPVSNSISPVDEEYEEPVGQTSPSETQDLRQEARKIEDSSSQKSAVLLFSENESNTREIISLDRRPLELTFISPIFPDRLTKAEIYDPDGGSNDVDNSPIVNRNVRGSYSRFSVGVSLAPDLSSNEIFRYNRLGRDLGVVFDYWVTPRLSISVGVFNTSKRYLVGGEEYSPPAGFWGNVTNGERPATIDADCQVLDIPINLKYQLVNRPKLNIYASAGVSSYIMLKEDYKYELENGWKSEWGISNENQHFFGVGNLQVHFERRFGKHMAVEVAPFFKVPLTGYGHGNIKFHSMGSFFTLRRYFLNQ